MLKKRSHTQITRLPLGAEENVAQEVLPEELVQVRAQVMRCSPRHIHTHAQAAEAVLVWG